MKITNISCNQFAGIGRRNVSFTEGINVIYGPNESGKSTLVHLLSRVLFQKSKLDGRSDTEFYHRFFPSAHKNGGYAADFVDGTVTLETEDGTYTLEKSWGADAGCLLSTPNGMIRTPKTVEEILRRILGYGEGVYGDLLFSSQYNTDGALQTILDATMETSAKKEIVDVISQAFVESGGVSVDAIEQAIKKKMDEIAGKHWDVERGTPQRKSGRWSNGLGEILKAYYALEDARMMLEKISELERNADRWADAFVAADSAAHRAEEDYERFRTFAGRLALQRERKKTAQRLSEDIRKHRVDLERWPRLHDLREQAVKLQGELADREALDTLQAVRNLQAQVTAEDQCLSRLSPPATAEYEAVKKAQRTVASLENLLCGMNLSAAVQMLEGHRMEITSLRTGEKVDCSQGLAAITEAVRLEIPGIMVMELMPANVDVASIQAQIQENRQIAAGIFAKYQVKTLEELEDYGQKIGAANAKIADVRYRISMVSGRYSEEELTQRCAQANPECRGIRQIKEEILAVCNGMDVATCIAKTEAAIEGYVRTYGSIGQLEVQVEGLEAELAKTEASLDVEADIPAEYHGIADPEDHLKKLQAVWKAKQEQRETALSEKSAGAKALETYREDHPDACQETLDRARQAFEEIQSLLNHWRHIQEVFLAQKEQVENNPMQDLARQFADYLGAISGGRISSEFPEGDKLSMVVYSQDRLLDYGKLSEGTKETVSFAFRLAILDHLFPDGGGVIVFDDPFTDMDEQRTAQAVRLLRECARKHQVIFLTCKEEYPALLEGNCIRF